MKFSTPTHTHCATLLERGGGKVRLCFRKGTALYKIKINVVYPFLLWLVRMCLCWIRTQIWKSCNLEKNKVEKVSKFITIPLTLAVSDPSQLNVHQLCVQNGDVLVTSLHTSTTVLLLLFSVIDVKIFDKKINTMCLSTCVLTCQYIQPQKKVTISLFIWSVFSLKFMQIFHVMKSAELFPFREKTGKTATTHKHTHSHTQERDCVCDLQKDLLSRGTFFSAAPNLARDDKKQKVVVPVVVMAVLANIYSFTHS